MCWPWFFTYSLACRSSCGYFQFKLGNSAWELHLIYHALRTHSRVRLLEKARKPPFFSLFFSFWQLWQVHDDRTDLRDNIQDVHSHLTIYEENCRRILARKQWEDEIMMSYREIPELIFFWNAAQVFNSGQRRISRRTFLTKIRVEISILRIGSVSRWQI